MQTPWSVVLECGAPSVQWTADVTEQLVVLNASIESTATNSTTRPLDRSTKNSAADGPTEKFLLCSKITPAPYDISFDQYCSSTPTVIVGAVPLRDHPLQHNISMKLAVRPGSTLEFSLVPTAPVSAEMLAHIKVTFTGIMLCGMPPRNEWRPVMEQKWFVVRSSVHKTTVTYSPPHILSPHRRAGEVVEARAVSSCGNKIQWLNLVESLLSEVQPYRKVFTPVRADKQVRIRRFPHRNADVIGFVPFAEPTVAIGQVVDEFENETYVLWATGGWSRVEGTGGPFLVEQRLEKCLVFSAPKMFTSSREGRGVRVRSEPTLVSKQLGTMEPNEVREAVASHSDAHGNVFVEWKGGRSFSCASGLHGSFLIEVTPVSQTLRCQPRRATRGPPSPDIIALDRPANKRPREESSESEDASTTHHGHNHDTPEDIGISPGLVPQSLRDDLARGRVSLDNLPQVPVGSGESSSNSNSSSSNSDDDSDEEGDEWGDDSSDDWDDDDTDEDEDDSSDDFDEDAL